MHQNTDWEKEVIPEYSKLAIENEDRADGYEMVPAIPFIRSLLQAREEWLKEHIGALGNSTITLKGRPIMPHVKYRQAIRDAVKVINKK